MIKDLEQSKMIKRIKDELTNYVGINKYRCPLCSKVFEWDDYCYDPAENIYTCPCCRTDIDEVDLLEVNVFELFEDMFIAYQDQNSHYQGDFKNGYKRN